MTASRTPVPHWPLTTALAVSALAHLVLLLALLLAPPPSRRGGQRAAQARTPILFIAAMPRPQTASAPPAPARTHDEAHPVLPAATPARTTPRKPAAQARPAPSAAPVAAAPPLPEAEREVEDVIGSIHGNWLEPPGINRAFRCRIRIDYAAGGMIAAVRFLSGCGNPALDDSVKRAVWKTQPLPLRTPDEAGSLEIDFTP